MEKMYKFNVAGHYFEVVLPKDLTAEDALQPYLPFVTDDEAELLFSLKLEYVDGFAPLDYGTVKERLGEEAPYFWILENEGKLLFGFSYTEKHPDFIIIAEDDFSSAVLHVPANATGRFVSFSLSNALMLMYTFRTAPYDTLMTHASVIRYKDEGYMFLGKSGTGKSTHSRMWLENIDGATLLNDDNPIVRVVDGKVFIYGSPWSGKTPCYKNEVVPLKGIVRIVRAPHNKAVRLGPLQSYASLKPSCSCMRWDGPSTDYLHKTVEKVVSRVACWHMECLPDADAANTCHASVTI